MNYLIPPGKQIHEYAAIVSDTYGVTIMEMRKQSRIQPDTIARQIAMYLAVIQGHHSRETVGAFFYRDYTTVYYAIKRVQDLMELNEDFRTVVNHIRQKAKQ